MRPSCSRLLLGLCAVLAPACSNLPAFGDPIDSSGETTDVPPAEDPIPQEPLTVPVDDGKDWIQLNSGEWLRGEVVRIRDGVISFDSDELDDLSIDLADVQRIRTATEQAVVTDDEKTFRGRLVLDDGTMWIDGNQLVQIGRDEFLASLHVDENDEKAAVWSGKLSLGLTTRTGNTDQSDFSAYAEAIRETARTRWTNNYTGAFSRANGIETANNHRLRTVYDVFLTRRLFLTVPTIDVYLDEFQNIDYRITPSALIGYELLDQGPHDWSLAVGPGYQYTRFDTPATDGSDDDSTAALTATSNYSWDITSDVEFDFDYTITAPIPDTDEYNHNFVMRLAVDLVNDLVLDVSFIWDRVNKPVADAGGNAPEPDDYRTTIGIGWSF